MSIYTASRLIIVNREYSNLTQFSSRRHMNLTDAIEVLALLRINNISTAYLINDDEISQSLFILSVNEFKDMEDLLFYNLRSYMDNAVLDDSLSPLDLEIRQNLINMIEMQFTSDFESSFFRIRAGLIEGDQSVVSAALQDAYNAAIGINTHLDELRLMAVTHIEQETNSIYEYSQSIIRTQFIVVSVILLIAAIISLTISKAIEKPIRKLEKAAVEITSGNLNFPIRSIDTDELGVLSNYIGDMVDAMKSANQAKTNFLANMSHEMRTPLNVVVGLTDLRMEDELQEDIREDLKKINSAGAILLGLVNDVLDISKIEAGKLELIPEIYHSASLLNDIITLNMIRIESKPIDFVVNINENLPAQIYGDELRVKQIFNNLLSNAFKYTKEGTVTLTVNSISITETDLYLSITVSDTGIGIRQEDLSKLFSEYNQVDTKANRKIEGTGLGLSITKNLVDLMDGKIKVESEYGKGTKFYVELKQYYVNEDILGKEISEKLGNRSFFEEKQLAANSILRPDLSYAKVLVVDDYPTNLDVASGMLKKYRMHVDCVQNGQAAIDLVKSGEPLYDAIFMDHMMPEMDGIEATRLIRLLDTEYSKNVPIISLTANALVGNEQMFLNEGFSAFLSKPINMLELDLIVKKWIRRNNQEHSYITDDKNQQYDNNKIDGVDMSVKEELYSGDLDMYNFVLESFAKNAPLAIDKMRNVSDDNINDYAVDIHALKSMAAAIGARDISERAKELEAAAKGELKVDEVSFSALKFINDRNDNLLDDTENLVKKIIEYLGAQQGQ